MSTFGGRFEEPSLDWISVDNFTDVNLKSSAFFLSHLHTDHMKGLDGSFFISLTENNKFLYCSEVTERFLRKKKVECFSNKNIISLRENSPFLLKVPNKTPVQVTLISAGHCPGSVMFLFELSDTKVLYTGDFRLMPCDLPKYKAFHNSDKEVKKLDAIYLDTTFASPKYETFPSREESRDALITIVKQWIDEKEDNKIGLVPPANYGLEFLVLELAKAVKQKIYIKNDILFENYSCICELSDYITHDSDSTNIHLCQQASYPYFCEYCFKDLSRTKRIRFCALRFTQKCLSDLSSEGTGIVQYSSTIINIAYSCHCSLEELKGFLKYLSRDGCKIHACVINKEDTEEQLLINLGVQPQNMVLEGRNEFVHHNKRQKCDNNTSKNPLGQDLNIITNEMSTVLSSTVENNRDVVTCAKNIFGLHSPPLSKKNLSKK